MRFINEVLPPDAEPFAPLVFEDHFVFLHFQLFTLDRNFETGHGLSQKALAQGVEGPDLKLVEIPALAPVPDVVDLLLELKQLLPIEMPLTNGIKPRLNDNSIDHIIHESFLGIPNMAELDLLK